MSTCRTCSHWSDWPHDDIRPDQYGICFNVDGMPPDDAQPAVYIEADFGCRLMTLQSFACSSWKAAERSSESWRDNGAGA